MHKSKVFSSRIAKRAFLFASAVSMFAVGSAKADIVTTLVGPPVQSGNNYIWTYDAELAFNSEITPNAGFSLFGTVYDVSSTLPAVQNETGLLASSFVFTETLLNSPATKVSPTDSASLYNIRFTYNGSGSYMGTPVTTTIPGLGTIQVGTGFYDLGSFAIIAPTNVEVPTYYDGQTIGSFGAAQGTLQANLGTTYVPTSAVPEPISLTLLGMGAISLLGRRRRA